MPTRDRLTLLLATLVLPAATFAGGPAPATASETTPVELPGAESHLYREDPIHPLRLFVIKPEGWRPDDRRPALVFFFGGGWTRGTPEKSIAWARFAASLGLIGIAPDYRTNRRHGTTPLVSVADGRAAVHWVQAHAALLGLDPARVVVGGNSAGGHVALWTAISPSPPGSSPAEAPLLKPRALILLSAVSDTSLLTGYTATRFGASATALSPVHQLDPTMPPILAFHGDADQVVPLAQALALRDRLVAAGNVCELHLVPGGGHNFSGDLPEWKAATRRIIREFLQQQTLLPTAPE